MLKSPEGFPEGGLLHALRSMMKMTNAAISTRINANAVKDKICLNHRLREFADLATHAVNKSIRITVKGNNTQYTGPFLSVVNPLGAFAGKVYEFSNDQW
jgi:hypothetical protein